MPILRVVGKETFESKAIVESEGAGEPTPFDMSQAIQPRSAGAEWLYTCKMYDNGTWEPAGSSREDVQEVIEIVFS